MATTMAPFFGVDPAAGHTGVAKRPWDTTLGTDEVTLLGVQNKRNGEFPFDTGLTRHPRMKVSNGKTVSQEAIDLTSTAEEHTGIFDHSELFIDGTGTNPDVTFLRSKPVHSGRKATKDLVCLGSRPTAASFEHADDLVVLKSGPVGFSSDAAGELSYIASRPVSDVFKVVDYDDAEDLHGAFTLCLSSGDLDQEPITRWRVRPTQTSAQLTVSDFRFHVLKHTKLLRPEFVLWFGDHRERLRSWTGNDVIAVLDPSIRFKQRPQGIIEDFVLDFSRERKNKASLPLRDIKARVHDEVQSLIDSSLLRIFLRKEELTHDDLSLKDSGLLSLGQMNGYEEIVLHVEFPQPTRMCSLCADERPIKEFPAWLPSPCGHESNACLNCIQIWIDSRLDAGAHDNITCPECNDRLAYDDVQMLATDEQFKRFDYLLTRGYLNTLGEFHWCLQPTCESGQIHDGVLGNIFQCNACMFSHCVTHKVPWHQGETCAEYDYRTDGTQRAIEEAASEQAIGAISNTCPNPLCRARINKVSGCDHMTCSRCHSSFCYICGKADAFFYGHSTQQSHEPECMYFNQQLPP